MSLSLSLILTLRSQFRRILILHAQPRISHNLPEQVRI